MVLEITDITRDASGTLRLSEQELKQLHDLDITVSDTETTGLRAGECGLTEFASIRSVKLKHGKPAYRLELLHHYVLPLRPEYQDYLEACKEAQANGEPAPPYDRKRYEYEIAPQALAVTGTRLLRDRPDGPITGMTVLGKQVEAEPFYALWQNSSVPVDISRFIRQGKRDVYYNTPFDKPFLKELIKDVQAYELAVSHAYLRDEAEQEETPDPVYEQIIADPRTEYLADVPYGDATDTERAEIIAVIRSHLLLPEEIENSALYQCLMHGFMKVHGGDGPRRLDDAYRAAVDPSFTHRAEHSAVEDICMAARVACAVSGSLGNDIPDMQSLYAMLVHRADKKAQVHLAPARNIGTQKKPKIVRGDLEIQFGSSAAQMSRTAQRAWKFLQSYDEAVRRNDRAAPHVLNLNPHLGTAIINAERKSPLSLSLLRKWIFFDQLQDSPLFEGFYPYDSAGVRGDIVLYPKGKKQPSVTVEDVPLQSFRANRLWLEAHPDLAEESLHLLREIHAANPRLGTVMLRGDVQKGLRCIFKGHQRAFGSVVIRAEAGQRPAQLQQQLIDQLEPLSHIGLLPHVEALEPADEDDTPASQDALLRADMQLGGKQLVMTLSNAMLQLMAHRLPPEARPRGLGPHIISTQRGEQLTLERQPDKDSWKLTGSLDAFHDYVQVKVPSPGQDPSISAEISEKPAAVLRDASWLLHRLSHLPGVYDVQLNTEGQLVLHQQDGVSLDVLNLLYRARLPFKVGSYEVKLDAGQLMRDAFYWSQTLERLQDDITADGHKDVQQQRMAAKPFLVQLHRALLKGDVKQLRVDDLQRCWVSDGYRKDDKQERYHLVDLHDSYRDYHCHDGQLDTTISPIAGVQHLEVIEKEGRTVVMTSPAVLAVYNAWRVQHGRAAYGVNLQGTAQVELTLSDAQPQEEIAQLKRIASRLYLLYGITGIERLPLADLGLSHDANTTAELIATLPASGLMNHSASLLQNLVQVYADIASSSFDALASDLRKHLPDTTQVSLRQASLSLLCDQLQSKSDPSAAHDGVDHIRQMSEQLTFFLLRLGGAEFADAPQALAYGQHIESDLGTLGFLTHELTRLKESQLQDSQEYLALQKALEHIRTAHEKLFNFYTANDALTEAAAVLRKALVGGDSRKGSSLIGALAQAQSHALFDIARTQAPAAYKSAAALRRAMAPFEQDIVRLWQQSEGEEQAHWQSELSSVFSRHVYRQLRQIHAAQKASGQDRLLLGYWVEKSDMSWSQQQQEEIIALFSGTASTRALSAAAKRLSACGLDADALIMQRRIMDDPYWQEETTETTPDDEAHVNEKICKAYERRAQHYIRLIDPQAHAQQEHQQSETYTQRARACLEKAGKTPEEIEKWLNRAGRHVSNRTFLRAQQAIARDVALETNRLEDHLEVVDLPGHEERARALMSRRSTQAHEREIRQIVERMDDPYSDLKQARALLRSVRICQKELHDLSMVRFHALRDLAATISLLFQLPQLRDGLPEKLHSTVQTIISRARNTPESYGLSEQTLPSVCRTQETIIQQVQHHACDILGVYGIDYALQDGGKISLPLAELARWVDRPLPAAAMLRMPIEVGETEPRATAPVQDQKAEAAAETAPPPSPDNAGQTPSTRLVPPVRLPRRQYAAALTYGTHIMLQSGRQDISVQWHLMPQAQRAEDALRCTVSLPYQETDALCQMLAALPDTPMGQGCRFAVMQQRAELSLPAEKLPAVASLLCVMQQLSEVPGIKNPRLMPSGMGIEGEVILGKGAIAREQAEGYLQSATFGMAVTRTPALEELFKGPAGSVQSFQVVLQPGLLSARGAVLHYKGAKANEQDAARIAAKMAQIPAHLRQRFIEGTLAEKGRAAAPRDESTQQAEALYQQLMERTENVSTTPRTRKSR